MKKQYEVIKEKISDTSEASRGNDIYYECTKCNNIIPSIPKDNINCNCLNIGIDKDMNRLFIEEYQYFRILRRIN